MAPFKLSIITPAGKVFDAPVDFVSVPGAEGSLGVLNRHAPLVSKLSKGVVRIKKEGSEVFFAVTTGIFEVNQKSECLLLTDKAVQVDSSTEAKNVNP